MTSIDELWGATLIDLRFDASTRHLQLVARVWNEGPERIVTLVLEGVSQFRVDRPSSEPWDYAEITSVFVDDRGSSTLVEVEFWTDTDVLAATCDGWSVQ